MDFMDFQDSGLGGRASSCNELQGVGNGVLPLKKPLLDSSIARFQHSGRPADSSTAEGQTGRLAASRPGCLEAWALRDWIDWRIAEDCKGLEGLE